ncbi:MULTISPECIES: hypothetical protein [Bacillus]|uniref:hypothetical protein n=1 Tax=Bacillus TaxID=1386 RepID=UPI0013EEEDEF|nr:MULTISPECIES: hypothetical protein [Bacillus]UIN46113.1 hypothetical protein LXN06_21015 [Bacillus licheniformis]MCY7837175.1 hypothetical protein [Bacillus haynesii]MCY8379495.1 hypothetical protein [Bacillus haynesii]MCY8551410.1 hypothetical protein [Bacillus haynesii]MCY9179002.1 hypothetical protein [Bacillus haynesii]
MYRKGDGKNSSELHLFRQAADKLLNAEKEFPNHVFKQKFRYFCFEEFHWVLSDDSWHMLSQLAAASGDEYIVMGGIEEWSDTWVKLPVDMSSETYLSVLTKGSDQNEDMITLASRVVWMSPSQKWVIYGSRTFEICVIGFNDDALKESLKSWQPLNDIVLGWISVIFYNQTIPPDFQEIFQRHYGEKT